MASRGISFFIKVLTDHCRDKDVDGGGGNSGPGKMDAAWVKSPWLQEVSLPVHEAKGRHPSSHRRPPISRVRLGVCPVDAERWTTSTRAGLHQVRSTRFGRRGWRTGSGEDKQRDRLRQHAGTHLTVHASYIPWLTVWSGFDVDYCSYRGVFSRGPYS